jgi:chromosome segregation ATPase
MGEEHPVGEHQAKLEAHEARLVSLEQVVGDLRDRLARAETHSETIFSVLEEIKLALKEYTVEMKKAISDAMQEINTMKARPSRLWDTLVIAGITGAVGYMIAQLVK